VYFGSSIGGLNSPEYLRADWSVAGIVVLL
jgi:hypothetical protein